jgi:hypothetical protein
MAGLKVNMSFDHRNPGRAISSCLAKTTMRQTYERRRHSMRPPAQKPVAGHLIEQVIYPTVSERDACGNWPWNYTGQSSGSECKTRDYRRARSGRIVVLTSTGSPNTYYPYLC